jgi:hypothetical protein
MPTGTLRYHLRLSACICGKKTLKLSPKAINLTKYSAIILFICVHLWLKTLNPLLFAA